MAKITVGLTLVLLSLVNPVCAKEMATKQECVEKVTQAIELIKKDGQDAALNQIMKKDGPFIWKDSYVFCIGSEVGKTLAHPVSRLLGFPMKTFKDVDGKQPFVEVLQIANQKGDGWKSYMYTKRGETEPRLKTIYFAKVPEKNVIVCAGYYE